MRKGILALLLAFLLHAGLSAQTKYALLIGINQYQIKDSVGKVVLDPKNNLYGCVNDAEAMKMLLINKFKFPAANITTLYNTAATRANILKQIDLLNAKCKPGDVAVVYYAGHGMPYRYGNGHDDIAEVILPTNSFVTVPFSCIQQAELAQKFNLFVDKKVTLTAVFDCCFSLANNNRGILMVPELISPDDTLRHEPAEEDNWTEPLPAEALDADEYELLPTDSSAQEDIFFVPQQTKAQRNRGLNLKQYQEMTRNVLPFGFTNADTTYNPPSQRENSPFIFISATNDKQTAPEMRDENGRNRGVFTYALTKVFETNPAGISFKEAFQKTTRLITAMGKDITPSARYKPNQRENKNLFGVSPDELKLKVYIPNESCTYDELSALYKTWINPLKAGGLKSQELKKSNPHCAKIYVAANGKSVLLIDGKSKKRVLVYSADQLKKSLKGQPFFVYLPVPKPLCDSIRKECLKNKKIELVSHTGNADLALYCTNYEASDSGWIDNILDAGRSLTEGMINFDYRDKLMYVGSNETVGTKRNKPGHSFSAKEEWMMPAKEQPGLISKKFAEWLNTKTAK